MGKKAAQLNAEQLADGTDKDGHSFHPYAQETVRRYRREGQNTAQPDLSYSDRFLSSIKPGRPKGRSEKAHVMVRPAPSQRGKARGLIKNGFLWFGLSPDNRRALAKYALAIKQIFKLKAGPPR